MSLFFTLLWFFAVAGLIFCNRMGDWHHREAVWWNAQYDTARTIEKLAQELPGHRAVLDILASRLVEEAQFRHAFNESQNWWAKCREGGRVRDGHARGTRESASATPES